MEKTIILAFGANLGNPRESFKNTFKMLEEAGIKTVKLSGVYLSKSYLMDEQPDYNNMVGIFSTVLKPQKLLQTVKEIENKLGRTFTGKWKERLIDIDIIDYNLETYESDNLTIPHKHMQDRTFVILPLIEIMPEYMHPKLMLTLKEIYSNITLDLDIQREGTLEN